MQKVIFRLDCSNKLGFGHLKRCMNLSVFLPDGIDPHFVIKTDSKDSDYLKNQLQNNDVTYIDLDISLDKEIEYWPTLKNIEAIFFDISNSENLLKLEEFQKLVDIVKQRTKKCILIDGLHSDSIFDKQMINGINFLVAPYVGSRTLGEDNSLKYLIGEKYFIFEESILSAKNDFNFNVIKDVENILITLGGGDPKDITKNILLSLEKDGYFYDKKVTVIQGPFFSKSLCLFLDDFSKNKPWVKVIKAPSNLVDYFKNSDICLTSTGLTKYELALLGIPTLIFAHDELSLKINESFSSIGSSASFGPFSSDDDQRIGDAVRKACLNRDERTKMSENGTLRIDGGGSLRIISKVGLTKDYYEKDQ